MKKHGRILIVQEEPVRIEIDIEDLEEELEKLGINQFFIKEKDCINLYMAQLIVEEYSFGRELRPEEKRGIVHAILNLGLLNKKGCKRLDVLVQRLEECGFNKQEIYAIIINLGVNGGIINESGCSYSDLLSNDKKAFQIIKDYSERVDKSVSIFTVITAASDYLNEEEQRQLKKEVEMWPLDKGKDVRHIYVAKRMVEEYMANQSLDNEGQSSLIFKLLNLKFEIKGRDERRRTEKRFCKALGLKELSKKDSYNIGEAKHIGWEQELIDRLENVYGINREFLEQKSSANIDVAEKIVNGADYVKELTVEEKKALLLKLLSSSSFGEKMPDVLPRMMDNFHEMGFDEQETYGVMINLFVFGIKLDSQTYGYWDFFGTNKNHTWKTIENKKAAIKTSVIIGPVTMKKLIDTAERAMKNAVAKVKNTGRIGVQISTRASLTNLAQGTQRVGSSEYNSKIL